MTVMRQRTLFIVVVALQLLVLLGMIAQRVYLLRTGQRVILRCAPVDPRSFFSGDYVRLNYAISSVSSEDLVRLNIFAESFQQHQTVFLALERRDKDRHYSAAAISADQARLKKRHPLMIRATVVNPWSGLQLRFGVEDYFVPQHQGPALERQMERVSVEVALNARGASAIRRLFLGDREVQFY